ncbi:hypothetical protein D9M68_310710 [compost metagenome]
MLDTLHQHAAVPGTVEYGELPAPRHVPPEAPEVGLRPLILGGCGDGHGAVLARVQRSGDAADRAALARRVVALEHRHQGMATHALVAQQTVEPRLFRSELFLVVVLVQLAAEVEAVQQAAPVQAGHERRRTGVRLAAGFLLEGGLQPFEDDAADTQAAVILVGAFDHVPGGVVAAGAAQHALAETHEAVVDLALLPVQRVELPAALGVLLQGLEALLELLLGQVEPELEDQRTLVAEHALEAFGLVDGLVQAGVLDLALDPRMKHLAVPVAEEDADPPLARQFAPEAPLRRPREFFVGRTQEALDVDQARVHPFVEQLDRLALAGAFDAVDQDEHRETRLLLQLELRIQQRFAQFQHSLLIVFLVD